MTSEKRELIVVKFGGSVLENDTAIAQAATLVRDTHQKGMGIAVVVSAMKGVTDNLLSLSKKVNPKISAVMLDDVLSIGEKTSARLLAAALAAYGLQPVIVDTESPYWPIVTDDDHLDANPMMDETRTKAEALLLPLLNQGKIPVVCGFLGKARDGTTTTLGRGGSDTTAVVLGNCLKAKEVVLIKDVEGVFSSDPDKVRDPQFIETLEGEEAGMLAMGGAKFLHVKALRYQTGDTRLRVTSLDKLDAGTIITGEFRALQVDVLPEKISMVTVVGISPSKMDAIIAKAAGAIQAAGGSVISLSMDAGSALFYVSGGREILDTLHELLVRQGLGKAITSFEGISMVTIKGTALETERGVIQRATQPLAREGINLFGVVTISSSIRIFVSSEQAQRAEGLIKEALAVDMK